MEADGQSGWYREHEGVLKRDDSSPLNATVLFCLCLSCSYSLHMSVQPPHSFARGEDVWQDLGDGNSLSTLSGFKLCRNFFCKNPFGGSCHTGRICQDFIISSLNQEITTFQKIKVQTHHFLLLVSRQQTRSTYVCVFFIYSQAAVSECKAFPGNYQLLGRNVDVRDSPMTQIDCQSMGGAQH